MAHDFSLVPGVVLDDYADFKNLSTNVLAMKTFYCKHDTYYYLAVCLEGFSFNYILDRVTPKSADEIDFDTNILPAALKVCDET